MKHTKRLIRALLAVFIVLAVLFLLLTSWWFGFAYPYFDSVAQREQRIPGLSSGLSPQGLCALPEGGQYEFAMSGYISGQPSRVYLIPEDSVPANVKKIERYVTFTENGKDIKTHFGGVTCSDDYMYIASGKKVIRIALESVLTAENGAAVEIEDSFTAGFGVAFCYIEGGMLYAGEFYRPKNYETDPSHHIETTGGTNHALVYCYTLDETREGGIADMVPTKVLSVCDQVQGIAVTDDRIYLSCSYGLPDSRLKIYPNTLGGTPSGTFSVDGHDVPLYILAPDAGSTLRMPCMSEEICFKNGRLYVLFESLSKKYRFFTFRRESFLRSLASADLENAHGAQKAFFGIKVK